MTPEATPGEDIPRTLVHPPTTFFISLVVGYILRIVFGGGPALPRAMAEGLGGLAILASLAIALSSVSAFAAGGETLKPNTPSRQLFTAGPYRFTRNPIYLAMMVFGVGFGIATSNSWILLTIALAGLILHFFVILPEERYLEDRFGPEYEAYKKRVRRWI